MQKINSIHRTPLINTSILPITRWVFIQYGVHVRRTLAPPCRAGELEQPPRSSSVPWRTPPQSPPPPAPSPITPRQGSGAPSGQLTRRELVGYDAVLIQHGNKNKKKGEGSARLGVVSNVLEGADTGAAHPLLRIIADEVSGAQIGDEVSIEEHLIPLVRSIVPRVDPETRTVYIDPPEGLLDLGCRRAMLQRIKRQLEPLLLASNSTTNSTTSNSTPSITSSNNTSLYNTSPTSSSSSSNINTAPLMPTRRQLLDVGADDLVRQISAAGGFLDVAQELGYRSVRRPSGYWEDEEALDRELSLFVAANWAQFEEAGDNLFSDDNNIFLSYTYSEGKGGERSSLKDTEGSSNSASNAISTSKSLSASGSGNASSVSAGGNIGSGSSIGNSGSGGGGEIYWYNQVTRRVQWTEPSMPSVVDLDDEGSVLVVDGEENRAMPSRNSLMAAGRYDLHAAIMGAGGYTQVAEDLDRWPAWPPTRHLRGLRSLKSELKDLVEEHSLPPRRLPSAKELQNLGRSDLHQAILRHGGYSSVAERIKWSPQRRPRGALRDAQAAADEILKFAQQVSAKSKGPLRMPTHAELRSLGRHDLRHALQTHGSALIAELAGLPANRQGGRSRQRSGWVEELAKEAAEAAAAVAAGQSSSTTDSNQGEASIENSTGTI